MERAGIGDIAGESSGVIAMGEVVNFNKAKKARARAEKERDAAANRTKHGRTKGEKTRDSAERDRRDHELDGARRGDDDTKER